MEYKDEIEKGVSRIPSAHLRKTLTPLFDGLRSELAEVIVQNKVEVPALDLDRFATQLNNLIIKSLITTEDVHSAVNKSVHNFVKQIPQPVEAKEIDINAITEPILKAIDEARVVEKADSSINLMDYRPHDQDTSNPVYKFYGFLNANGAWYIVRDDTKALQQRYAASNGDYAKAWEQRVKLKYGYLSEVI